MTRADRGFTLLEVLVAVAVLGLALVSLLGLHVRNLALIDRDQRVTEATLFARALMTEVEVGPFPEIGLSNGDFRDWEGDSGTRERAMRDRSTDTTGPFDEDLHPGLRWEREILPTPLADLREVRIRVFRGERESGDDVTLAYYVRRR